jgi:hypothetical protein
MLNAHLTEGAGTADRCRPWVSRFLIAIQSKGGIMIRLLALRYLV